MKRIFALAGSAAAIGAIAVSLDALDAGEQDIDLLPAIADVPMASGKAKCTDPIIKNGGLDCNVDATGSTIPSTAVPLSVCTTNCSNALRTRLATLDGTITKSATAVAGIHEQISYAALLRGLQTGLVSTTAPNTNERHSRVVRRRD
jgi:hypothetical protein